MEPYILSHHPAHEQENDEKQELGEALIGEALGVDKPSQTRKLINRQVINEIHDFQLEETLYNEDSQENQDDENFNLADLNLSLYFTNAPNQDDREIHHAEKDEEIFKLFSPSERKAEEEPGEVNLDEYSFTSINKLLMGGDHQESIPFDNQKYDEIKQNLIYEKVHRTITLYLSDRNMVIDESNYSEKIEGYVVKIISEQLGSKFMQSYITKASVPILGRIYKEVFEFT